MSKFCCVGAPHYCAGGRVPHHVHANPAQPQRALVHLVEWTHASAHRTRVEIHLARQCASCARMLLERGFPLSIVAMAAFRDVERRARREAAECSSGCVECETDGANEPQQQTPPQNVAHGAGSVYRRGRILLWIPYPGSREMLINPRERPCELCHAGQGKAHTAACPCVNVESVPERRA